MADKRGVASCLEVGPRYLHSTGQLHKGGPNSGVFLILSADELKDIPLKEEAESLGTLAKAQADLQKAQETLEERKLIDRAKGLLMDKADFSEQGAFRWIQKTSMDQRIPKKRLALAIIEKYGDPKPARDDR